MLTRTPEVEANARATRSSALRSAMHSQLGGLGRMLGALQAAASFRVRLGGARFRRELSNLAPGGFPDELGAQAEEAMRACFLSELTNRRLAHRCRKLSARTIDPSQFNELMHELEGAHRQFERVRVLLESFVNAGNGRTTEIQAAAMAFLYGVVGACGSRAEEASSTLQQGMREIAGRLRQDRCEKGLGAYSKA